MRIPIYKSRDAAGIRVYADEIRPDTWAFTQTQCGAEDVTYELSGDEAAKELEMYRAADSLSFFRHFSAGPETLARTGRPSRAPMRIASAAAFVTTLAAFGFVVAPDAQAPDTPLLKDVTTAPVVTPSPNSPSPYRPEPREPRQTTRDEERKALAPMPSPTVVKPSQTPATKRPIAKPPADIRISFYRDCTGHAQECIDAGTLTMYARKILAGHNYDGYQWLSRVPVGRTVRVISGPLAGTYRVYGHLRINRQGGTIPAFSGGPDLVLQTCEGSGTGFSLLHRA